MAVQILPKRGTRAEVNAEAAAGRLVPWELIFITDEGRLAVCTSAGTYATMAREGEGGSASPGQPDVRNALRVPPVEFEAWIVEHGNRSLVMDFLQSPTGFSATDVADDAIVRNLTETQEGANLLLNYARPLRLVSENPTQWAKWLASPVMTPTRNPVMTDFDAPSGQVSASSTNGAYRAYQAFDETVNIWINEGTEMANQWLRYDFENPVYIHTAYVTPGGLGMPTSFRIEFSDDGTTWRSGAEVNPYAGTEWVETSHTVVAAGRHRHWRLLSMTNQGFGSVNELRLEGFA